MDGVPSEAHLGRSLSELPTTILVQAEGVLRRVRDTGEPVVDVEIIAPSSQGVNRSRQMLASCYPVQLGAGVPFGIGCVCR